MMRDLDLWLAGFSRPQRNPRPRALRPPRLRLLTRRGPVKVYLVDPTWVRKQAGGEDFTMGSHDRVLPGIIPRAEVWISSELEGLEQRLTMLHELFERRMMAGKRLGYDQAHEMATELESSYRRRNGRGLKAALRRERGR